MQGSTSTMETNTNTSRNIGADILVSDKGAKSKNGDVQQSSDFVEQFLSMLVSDMNVETPDVNQKQLSEIPSELVEKLKSIDGIKNLDLKSLLSNLKTELSNIKEIADLDLSKLKDLISKLNLKPDSSISEKAVKTTKIGEFTYSTEIGDSEQFLSKIKKYLSNSEFEKIKNNLQKGDSQQISKEALPEKQFAPIGLDISEKESSAKLKISNKNTTSLNDILQPSVKLEDTTIASSKLDKGTLQEKQSQQSIIKESIVNEIGKEQSGTFSKEGSLSSDGKQQGSSANLAKEKLQAKVAKTQIADLITSTKTETTESAKADTTMRSNFVEKAIKTIKLAKNGVSSNARIVLQPRQLGSVNMRMNLIGNSVSLVIKAEKSETLQHLEKQLPALKEKLTESGLRLDQITYESSESNDLQNDEQNNNRHEQEELRRKFVNSIKNRAAKGRFEIADMDLANYNYSHLKVTN